MKRVSGRLRSSAGFVTVGVAFAVVAATIVVLSGVGKSSSLFHFGSGFAWLASNENDQLVSVNGGTGQGVAKVTVPGDPKSLKVEQRDGHAVVVADDPDGTTRVLYRLDDETGLTSGTATVTQRDEVIQGGGKAYLVNKGEGSVQPIDPETLEPAGKPLKFTPPILGSVDDDGHLVVVESGLAKVSIVDGDHASEPRTIGSEGDQFQISTIGGRPVVLNASKSEATVFDKGQPKKVAIPPGQGDLVAPADGEGDTLAVLRRDGAAGSVLLVDLKNGGVKTVPIPGSTIDLEPPLVTDGAVFLVDPQAGSVKVVDPGSAKIIQDTPTGTGKGPGCSTPSGPTSTSPPRCVNAFVKDGYLWVNDVDGQTATVVDHKGHTKQVDKYDKKIPELNPVDAPAPTPNDPPSPPQPTPPTQTTPPAPTPVAPPSPTSGEAPPPVANAPATPPGFTARPGNQTVYLTWDTVGDGGSPLTSYRLSCTPDCGGSSETTVDGTATATTVEGLKNGTDYRFSLVAINAIGESRPATATATPTADVPPVPTDVAATANPDGTVDVSWKVDAGGLTLTGFTITATSDNPKVTPSPKTFDVTDSQKSSYRIAAGELGYDADNTPDYSFAVQASARPRNGSTSLLSDPSTPSNKVDPFSKPAFAAGVTPQANVQSNGTVILTWAAANANGRPVTYTVGQCTGPGTGCTTVSATTSPATIGGLTFGATYYFQVIADNDAGASTPIVSAATRNAQLPTVLLSNMGAVDGSTVFVNFTVDWHGSAPGTCSGGNGGTCSQRTQNGLSYYTYAPITVCATNALGDQRCAQQQQVRTNPKVLTADGSHWGCPGTYCGPDVSRMKVTSWVTDRLVVTKGTQVSAQCQQIGDTITDPKLNTSTNLWVRTSFTDGYIWMSAHYFGTTDFASVVSGLAQCASTPP